MNVDGWTLGMAPKGTRATAEIAPSMAVGFTINHIGAMVFPVVGGLLWMIDYRIPFVAGAVLSLISLLAVQLITGQIRQVAEDSSQRK